MLFKKIFLLSLALLASTAADDVTDDVFGDACEAEETALDNCVETNNCDQCEDEIGDGPEEQRRGAVAHGL